MEDLTDLKKVEEPSDIKPEGWKNPPNLMDLKNDLEMAKPTHDLQVDKIDEWLEYLHVEGRGAPRNIPDNRSKIQPKLIRKQAEWRYASLSEPFLATDDMFTVKPVTWEDADAARQNALVLNNQFNTKIDKQAFIDSYIRAAVDEGTAIVRTGWISEEEEYEEAVPKVGFTFDEEIIPLMQYLTELEETNPTGYKFDVPEELKMAHERTKETGMPQKPMILGYEMETRTRMKINAPTLEVCDYKDVIVDPTCKNDLSKASFIIFKFETSLAELEKDGKYTNLDKILVETNSTLADPDSGETDSFSFRDKPRKRIVAYEYWGYWDIDGIGQVRPFVCTWVGDVMIRLEDNPFPDNKPPFVAVPLMPTRKSVYGEPDGELLKDNQQILGAVMRGMIDIMARSANGQMGTRKDALDATNKRKFQRGMDYEYNGNVDPRLAFHMHTYPEIPASAQYLMQLQNVEAESMTGVKAFAGGINSDALGDVVAGIKGVMDSAAKRETGILRRLAKGLTDVARKIIAMNAVFMEDEEVVRITNGEFVNIRRDDLAGHFDLRLDIATAEEDNAKAQELAFMLQTMGNTMDIGISKLILRDIARLRKMPELAHKIENFEPQPDETEMKMKQLEMAKLEAQIKEFNSRAERNITDAQLNQAKTRDVDSTADLKDLDFVEQESGVKQEREKELRSEQARGNMALESHKAGLTQETEKLNELQKYLAGQ